MAEWSIATVCKTVAFMAPQVRILLRPPKLNFPIFFLLKGKVHFSVRLCSDEQGGGTSL